ncbi:MAG TPA: thioredoxin domain-containing protein [Vicinamibacterales bacterium]|nr:thioredoxin domain-containing protein [Vicinamibacterales bacterium]
MFRKALKISLTPPPNGSSLRSVQIPVDGRDVFKKSDAYGLLQQGWSVRQRGDYCDVGFGRHHPLAHVFSEAEADTPQPIELTTDRVPLGSLQTVGVSTAPLGMIEFADYQCPFCVKFAESVFPQIKAKYVDSGLVRFEFRNFPLPIHPLADDMAVAGVCLTKSRGFMSAHDFLFAGASDFTRKWLPDAATALGMTSRSLEACSEDPASTAYVDQDVELARRLGVDATPTFIIGRSFGAELQVIDAVVGAGEFKDFEKLLDAARAVASVDR